MKRLLSLISVGLILVAPAMAAQVTVTWDHNEPRPEGYRVFQRLEDAAYDYTAPAWQGPENIATITYDDPIAATPASPADITGTWDQAASEITVTWSQPAASASRTDYWIVRAYEGEAESADSEEVNLTKTVVTQITRWDIFFSETEGGPWTPLYSLDAGAGANTITTPLTIVRPGETKTVYFTVVAFAGDGQFSPDAPGVAVTVDRPGPQPPSGVTVKFVTIPVQ